MQLLYFTDQNLKLRPNHFIIQPSTCMLHVYFLPGISQYHLYVHMLKECQSGIFFLGRKGIGKEYQLSWRLGWRCSSSALGIPTCKQYILKGCIAPQQFPVRVFNGQQFIKVCGHVCVGPQTPLSYNELSFNGFGFGIAVQLFVTILQLLFCVKVYCCHAPRCGSLQQF